MISMAAAYFQRFQPEAERSMLVYGFVRIGRIGLANGLIAPGSSWSFIAACPSDYQVARMQPWPPQYGLTILKSIQMAPTHLPPRAFPSVRL